MSTAPKVVALADVFRMLDTCAPGHKAIQKLHLWCVIFEGRSFKSLPVGDRSSRKAMIEAGKVRSMVRHLHIDAECALRELGIAV